MKIWTLFEESNIKEGSLRDNFEKIRNYRTFGNFEDAKAAMRKLIKSYATMESELFDEDGQMIGLDQTLLDNVRSDYFDSEEDKKEKEKEAVIQAEILHSFFLGENIESKLIDLYDDFKNSNEVVFESDYWKCGFTDIITGRFKRTPEPFADHYEDACDTFITNALVMKDPTIRYFCWVHNEFDKDEDWDVPSYFHIELVMTEVE